MYASKRLKGLLSLWLVFLMLLSFCGPVLAVDYAANNPSGEPGNTYAPWPSSDAVLNPGDAWGLTTSGTFLVSFDNGETWVESDGIIIASEEVNSSGVFFAKGYTNHQDDFKLPACSDGYGYRYLKVESSGQTDLNHLSSDNGDVWLIYLEKDAPIEYTIHFDSNGATNGSMASQKFTIENKETPLNPCNFNKLGYEFVEWQVGVGDTGNLYSDGCLLKDFFDNQEFKDTREITLYAKWRELNDNEKFTLTLSTNKGGEAEAIDVLYNRDITAKEGQPATLDTLAAGSKISATATESGGYRFVEWRGSTTAADGEGATIPLEDLLEVGYAASNATIEFDIPSGDVTLEAIFEQVPADMYTLTLVASDGGTATASFGGVNLSASENGQDSNENVPQGSGITATATANEDEDYVFSHWECEPESLITSGTETSEEITFTMPGEDVKLTAHFKEKPANTRKLTLFVSPDNSGTATAIASDGAELKATDSSGNSERVTENEQIKFTATPNAGYKFSHWKGTGSGMPDISSEAVLSRRMSTGGDATMTAHFVPQEYELTVNVDPDGAGTAKATASSGAVLLQTASSAGSNGKVKYGDTVTATATESGGYKFVDWTCVPDNLIHDLGKPDISFTMPAENVKLTANFTAENNPIVTFHANYDGSIATDSQSFVSGVEQSLKLRKDMGGDFQRADASFDGWNTKADGSGTSYSDGALFTTDSNADLYAQWEENSSTPDPEPQPRPPYVPGGGRPVPIAPQLPPPQPIVVTPATPPATGSPDSFVLCGALALLGLTGFACGLHLRRRKDGPDR